MHIRRILSEERRGDLIIRRHEVETPSWFYDEPYWFDYPRHPLERLFVLELRMTARVAGYFAKVPYLLADSIVHHGFRPFCFTLFCCCDWDVLYYPMEPVVRSVTNFRTYRGGPIVLAVAAEDEFHLLYGNGHWPTPKFGFGFPLAPDGPSPVEQMRSELARLKVEDERKGDPSR